MAEFQTKGPDPHTNIVWRRLASPREALFGIRTDGTIRSICSKIEIISSVEINQTILEECAEHFNRDMGCFHEFFMEKKESKDVWLVKLKENNYEVKMLEKEIEKDQCPIEKEINCQLRAEDIPKWKLYFNYVGSELSLRANKEKLLHIYQMIFVFSTGTLDELSCALICDLFLNILDHALKDDILPFYSVLNLYDIGTEMEASVNRAINCIVENKRNYEKEETIYRKLLKLPTSFFDFKREIENNNSKFTTIRLWFPHEIIKEFTNIFYRERTGHQIAFVTMINYVLFRHALKNGFEGNFYTKVLHILNARCTLNENNNNYTYKLGSYFLPYMQYLKLDTIEVEEFFKEASKIEMQLYKIIRAEKLWNQEAFRELSIKETENKYNSGKWNPNYCFSVTHLGYLEECFTSQKKRIHVVSYERASSNIEGGHLDAIIYSFRDKLAVHFDFSREHFSDNEMLSIIYLFCDLVKAIIYINI